MVSPAAPAPHRGVRSFVVRAGRVTPGQRRALEHLGDAYLLDPSTPLDPEAVFGRGAPLYLEVGFGNGEALLTLARAHPERDFIGVEVYPAGIGRLLNALEAEGLANVRAYRADAAQVLETCIAPGQLAGVYIWFPDPWPKKRHHKRRLVQPAFLERVTAALAPGGLLHLATDWQDYAEHMLRVANAETGLASEDPGGGYAHGPGERPVTRFQRRGEGLGHGVWDLRYRRRGGDGA